MPDVFAIVAFDGIIPDPLTAAVIQLLKDERSYTDEADPLKFRHDAASIKGMYALAGTMAISPKIDASVEYGEGDTLGRREIAYMDVCALYWQFRIQTRKPIANLANTSSALGLADSPQNSV
jgi:hypothetical protein